MRKAISLVLFISGALALILILASFFPKYMGMLLFLAVFLMGDLVLWLLVRAWIKRRGKPLKLLLPTLFWLPATVLFCMVIAGLFIPFISWNVTAKAILLSLLLMTIISKMIPLILNLLSRLVRLVASGLFATGISWLRWVDISSWLLGSVVWLTMLTGMIVWAYDFKVVTVDVRSPKIPASFENFRIVQVSDIHLGNWIRKQKLIEAIGMMNSLKPDLVVFTGDMFTYSSTEGQDFISYLKQIKARYGVYAVLGNHDYGDYVKWESPVAKQINFTELKDFYHELGWKLLLNSSAVIRLGNDSINILGVENWGAKRRFQRYGDISKAGAGINKSYFSILLSHDPSYWDSIISKQHPEVDLTLSGHTHGGQVGIEDGSLRWSIISAITPLWGGLYLRKKDGLTSTLYVNEGLGTVGYSGRIGIRPEITLIILHTSE